MLKYLNNFSMQRFDLIVFDWDGTLVNSADLIAACVQNACRDLRIGVPEAAAARFIIGLGLADALNRLLPNLAPDRYGELAERYRHHFLACEDEIPLFNGVVELLGDLTRAGYLLAVATGKSRAGLDRSLKRAGLASWFAASRCADECFSKPHPAMLLELMAEFGVAPERTLMVGDTVHDLQMAANAGCPAVAVTCGAHPRDQLLEACPIACLADVTELRRWLNGN